MKKLLTLLLLIPSMSWGGIKKIIYIILSSLFLYSCTPETMQSIATGALR